MDVSQAAIDALVAAPTESLKVELKRWLDLDSSRGQAKIAIGCMALRNRDGGYLIIGFDDKTLSPDEADRPADVQAAFHPDKVQEIVSRHSSDLFEIKVRYGVRDGLLYPVLIVDEGVRVPVAAKRELMDEAKTRHLVRQDAVYFRTLRSNGMVSSSAATHADWNDILDICFENREADIGRFLRRHLGQNSAHLFSGQPIEEPDAALRRRAFELLDSGLKKQKAVFESEEFQERSTRFHQLGRWSAALVLDPPLIADDSSLEFYRTVTSSNPRYTGWPIWLDSSGFAVAEYRPRKKDKGWESVIVSNNQSWSDHADFYRFHARGDFFLSRVMEDDLTDKVEPHTAFDAGLTIYRVAETIAVGLAFAKALHVSDNTRLAFAFRWDGISGRELRA
ncbi:MULTISPECIES: ATP-binding protein [Rhizobiaceae]|uniref:Uncharacterized protein n=1 Tax=Aliirhizobium cellulosilyticum TaxID=393664 RepID=A0A7W6WQJ0_9HYPH|nr:ATP-binding protein [Rhizobium cellulosilyticum]MBB4349201.1 hypothetical protein [Rhizobium cellulosilyticum]MBB4412578.1 hypothetical protein [Rhizobium cellulosilyticum]MBB4447210.1 hypothetical protein [Rhizobium cellulosilyticum]